MAELLTEGIKKQIQDVFAGLENRVKVLYFTRSENCDYCEDTRRLLEEVVALSDKISMDVYDLEKDSVEVRQYKIDKAPAMAIMAQVGEDLVDYGIRYYGIPAGHEFTTLINDLVMVSGRQSNLGEQTVAFLRELKQPVHLQVFVTPT